MKNIFIVMIIGFKALQANAVTVEVLGRNGVQYFHGEVFSRIPLSVGEVSIGMFDFRNVPYVGSVSGISELFNLGQNVDVISNTEMKAYGWCFSIDGEVPETMADQTIIEEQHTKIIWYYAYAHYKDGEWIGQCVKD